MSETQTRTDESQLPGAGASANRITIDLGKGANSIAICSALCGMAVVASIWAAYTARDAATEVRVAEYYLMDPNSRTPEEMAAWAKFRKEHER